MKEIIFKNITEHLPNLLAILKNSNQDQTSHVAQWLHLNIVSFVQGDKLSDAEKIECLKYFFTQLEQNKCSQSELMILSNSINEIIASQSQELSFSSILSTVYTDLGITYSDAHKRNADFLGFLKTINLLTYPDASNKNSFPTLDELIALTHLMDDLACKEQLKIEKTTEKEKYQGITNIESIVNHVEGYPISYVLGYGPLNQNFANEGHIAAQKVDELIHEIKELSQEIATLRHKIHLIETKKEILINEHGKKTYQTTYPLHYAVQKGNVEQAINLLLDEEHDYNQLDNAGFSPIHYAFNKKNDTLFHLLYACKTTSIQEKDYFKNLVINDSKYLEAKPQDQLTDSELNTLKYYQQLNTLFNDEFNELWNNIDPKYDEDPARVAHQVINVLSDYYSPQILRSLAIAPDTVKRILTGHWGRHHTEKAEQLVHSFKQFLIPLDAPDNELINRREWDIDDAIRMLRSDTQSLSLLKNYNPQGSFAVRLAYLHKQLPLQRLNKEASKSNSSQLVFFQPFTEEASSKNKVIVHAHSEDELDIEYPAENKCVIL